MADSMPIDDSRPLNDNPSTSSVLVPRGELEWLFFPHCDCDECSQQYRSVDQQKKNRSCYRGYLETKTAATEIRDFLEAAAESRKYLQKVLREYGTTIVLRWKRRSRKERRDILKRAEPLLGDRLWHRFDTLYAEQNPVKDLDRPLWLLPYLSYECLAHDYLTILRLLYQRSSHSLQEWFPFDLEQTKTAWETGLASTRYSPWCVAIEGATFGQLIAWSPAAAHGREMIGFPRATLVFEAQHILLRLLKNLVTLLLSHPSDLDSDRWYRLVNEGFVSNVAHEAIFPPTSSAFSNPVTFDTTQLAEMAQGQLHDADDDLWLLQTDPA